MICFVCVVEMKIRMMRSFAANAAIPCSRLVSRLHPLCQNLSLLPIATLQPIRQRYMGIRSRE